MSLEKKQYEDSEAEDQLPVELTQDKASFQGQKCPSGNTARLRSLEKKQNEDSEAEEAEAQIEEQLPVEQTQDDASFQGQIKCPSGGTARLQSLEKKRYKDSDTEDKFPAELIQGKKCSPDRDARMRPLDQKQKNLPSTTGL